MARNIRRSFHPLALFSSKFAIIAAILALSLWLGSAFAFETADEKGIGFTYNLISTWNINDSHAPKSEFEKKAMEEVNKTGEPYKEYQEIGGQKYFSALYPDKAVAEACVTCHNTHPVHLERYPDKKFELDEVMGGVIINLPIEDA